ncbi:MAG: ABC transporter permease [Thermomicrobiales bacterium]
MADHVIGEQGDGVTGDARTTPASPLSPGSYRGDAGVARAPDQEGTSPTAPVNRTQTVLADSAGMHRKPRLTAGRAGLRIGMALLLFYAVVAIVGPFVVPGDPYKQHLRFAGDPPSWSAPLGYDELGRDMLARIVHGARYTLGIGITAIAIGGGIGIALGAVAGYLGGVADSVIMRLVDIMLAFPSILLALAIVSTLGTGLINLIIATGLYAIPQYARLTRATFLSLGQTEFVHAATVSGAGAERIILRHLLPNALAPLIVQTSYATAAVILAASGLSFLGLGVQPPTPEWGAMLSRGRDLLRVSPHVVTVPGLAIAFLILALNLAGDGIRDATDPRWRQR